MKDGNCIIHYPAVLKAEELLLMVLGEFRRKGISTDIPTKVCFGIYKLIYLYYLQSSKLTLYQEYIIKREGECPTPSIVPCTAVVRVQARLMIFTTYGTFKVYTTWQEH